MDILPNNLFIKPGRSADKHESMNPYESFTLPFAFSIMVPRITFLVPCITYLSGRALPILLIHKIEPTY